MAEYDPLVSEAARRRTALPSYDGYRFEPSDGKWRAPIKLELVSGESKRPAIAWYPEQFSFDPQVYGRRSDTWGSREVRDDDKLFDRFLRLSQTDKFGSMQGEKRPERALRFVKRYGVLPIPFGPRHYDPFPRTKFWDTAEHLDPTGTLSALAEAHDTYANALHPLPVYRLCNVSKRVRNILKLVSSIDKGERGDRERWLELRRWDLGSDDPELGLDVICSTPSGRRNLLAEAVNQWLDVGRVRVGLHWPGLGPQTVAFRVDSLLGAIVRHMFLTLTHDRGVALCNGCGEIFVPERRKPKRRQHTWCRECGKEGGYKAAKRVSRRKRTDVAAD